LAVLPTGAGKSLCYQFPALYLNQLVIVISPLIALMKDQVSSLQKKGIAAGSLHSGQSEDDKRQVFSQINEGGTFILYLSPERVQKEGFQKWIMNRQIALFAIDEAHCVSQWGHDFREEYGELKVLKTLRPDIPILALTASATPMVLDDVAKNLQMVKPQRLVHGFYRPNLYYQVETTADDQEKSKWLLQALKQNPTGRVLIYCGTRKVTEDLAHYLQESIEKVGFYHAGLSTSDRTHTQEEYQRGQLRILVATNAFGMGIDQPDVRLVVHFQMPANIDSLYQEMGRAGRDGFNSTCLMLYSKKDKGLQSFFIQNSKAKKAIKDLRWRNLEALVSYCEAGECRHSEILTYYKDSQRLKKCGHCDVCDPASDRKIFRMEENVIQFSNRKKAKTLASDLNPVEEKRFQILRQWRKTKATELDIPAFVIFGDKTLKDLAQKNPQNLDELKDIYGIGESKLEKYGWDLLAELATK
jgi:ATP-dependent DNA helicase RecQ